MDKERLVEKKSQETKNENNFSSKILANMISVIITLIVCFMISVIAGNISSIIFFISIYIFISSIIMKNISSETEFGENITKAIIKINKILLIIICVIASLKIFIASGDDYGKYIKNSININIFDIIGYIYILLIILYFCMQKKDYLFSLVNAIVTIIFLNNIVLYLIEKNIDDTNYGVIMFLAIACICVIYNFLVKYVFKNEKWKGIKLASNFINVLFIPILIIASITQICINNKLEIESVISLIIIIIILTQKIIYFKSEKNKKLTNEK